MYLFNRSGEIYSNFKDQENKNYLLPSDDIYEILDQNRVYIFQLNKNSISAYKKINFLGDVFMQVNRELNTNIWDHVSATKDAYNIYTTKESERLLRLPMYYDLNVSDVQYICKKIKGFFND